MTTLNGKHKVFVANCTKQPHDFIFRVPEENKTRMQRIMDGHQVPLSGEYDDKQIEAIVSHHAKYGLIRSDEVDRSKIFNGLCYSIDKPVPLGILMKVLDHNSKVLTERGQELRKEAAVAVSETLNKNTDNTLSNFEVDVVEEKKGSEDGTGFEERLRVADSNTVGRNNEVIPRSERKPRKGRNRN